MSKGSKQRRSQVPDKQVEDNWNMIFKRCWNKSTQKDSIHDLDQRLDEQSKRMNRSKK